MKNKTQASAAGKSAAAKTNQTATTVATSTPAAPAENAVTVTKVKLRFPPMKKAAKAPKVKTEGKRVTGVTFNVAKTSYNNWRSDAKKWGIDELVNGEDKTAARKARFLRDETALEGAKYGGYISVAPAHVDEVVAILNKWNHDNKFHADGTAKVETEQMVEQFTMLETPVEIQPKPRATKATSTEVTAETTEVAEA